MDPQKSGDSITDRALPKLDKYSYPKYESSTMINFLLLVGGAVRMIADAGDELENFLDAWLNRETCISRTRPAFLSNPDLDCGSEADEEENHGGGARSAEAASAASADDSADDSPLIDPGLSDPAEDHIETPKTRGKPKYRDLGADARKLDTKLFLMLRSVITAPEIRSLLESYRGKDATETEGSPEGHRGEAGLAARKGRGDAHLGPEGRG